eukprot:6178608-Pleurochrysis_carterae.AAC.1
MGITSTVYIGKSKVYSEPQYITAVKLSLLLLLRSRDRAADSNQLAVHRLYVLSRMIKITDRPRE